MVIGFALLSGSGSIRLADLALVRAVAATGLGDLTQKSLIS